MNPRTNFLCVAAGAFVIMIAVSGCGPSGSAGGGQGNNDVAASAASQGGSAVSAPATGASDSPAGASQ